MKKIAMLAFMIILSIGSCKSSSDSGIERIDRDNEQPQQQLSDQNYRYDPVVEVTTIRATDTGMKFREGESLDQNIWTDIFEEQYGIKVTNLWVVDSLQYNQKLNIAIAAGHLPDFFLVSKEEMKRLYEANQLEELTDLLDEYGSDYLKELLQQDQGGSLQAATYNRKLMGLPKMMVNGGVSTGEVLWVRTDWLKKLDLPEPRTINDLQMIAEAFTHGDPDENGLDDTVGLGINNELFMYHGSLKGFFNGFRAYPDIWLEQDGQLVYGSIQPEMMQALAVLQEMYKQGSIDAEFLVKPWTKLAEEIAEGKLGLAYGSVSDGGYIQRESRANDTTAEWKPYPIVSIDGSAVDPQLLDTADSFYVVRKGMEHPEILIKLANIYLHHYYELNYAPEPNPFVSTPDGVFPGRYHPVVMDPQALNLEAYRQVQQAIKEGDGDRLPFPANVHYDRLMQYEQGNESMWFSTVVFGSEGSFSVIDAYDQQGLGIYNAFQGAGTPTMIERLDALKRLQHEAFTKIIMGEEPTAYFEQFVKEWLQLGGEQITQEVNQWYAEQR